jgi:hypothetical protein
MERDVTVGWLVISMRVRFLGFLLAGGLAKMVRPECCPGKAD